MTNFILEQNVTSLSDSKRLAEAGYDLEADDEWMFLNDYKALKSTIEDFESLNLMLKWNQIKAYRLDRLLAELPDPCEDYGGLNFDFLTDDCGCTSDEYAGLDRKTEKRIRALATTVFLSRGQEAIKAAVDLLILLKENNATR